ncbi:dipeptidase [Parasedimentitalea huanghaiensis]|uniref:Peptidase M19 n=1 Tax=Parasedimentitalea huanghaiensis TaxID=2682100 RepID=A0A6L6WJN9_9RHOB|nr:membrane dipeptidase [Zongyanglinia huanghaiensis]MVO16277.1 peptidase M19 [Zongyanglinia huanghaiensis]
MRKFGKWLGRLLILAAISVIAGLIFLPGYLEESRNLVAEHSPYPISPEAAKLHNDLIIGDWHADPLLWNRDLSKRGDRGHVDIPRLIEGNVALQMFTAVTKSPAGQNYDHNDTDAMDNITLLALVQMWPPRTWGSLYQRALYQAEKLHSVQARSEGRLRIIRTEADLDALMALKLAGVPVVGGLLGIEGAHPLEGDLSNLQGLQDAGYRMLALQHFFDNELGGSLHGSGNAGLTDFGRKVVQAVVDRGLILDVAHSSPQVARDVLRMTDIPLVVSHTGIYKNCEVKRNFPDDLMQEIAATGGVIGIGYWADVTCDDSPAGVAKTIKTAIEVVGEDAVSLGSDFDGSVQVSFDTSELAALTQAMMDAGLTEGQIRKVAGENMLRVLRARLE